MSRTGTSFKELLPGETPLWKFMFLQRSLSSEPVSTHIAFEWRLTNMNHNVPIQIGTTGEILPTGVANIRLLARSCV